MQDIVLEKSEWKLQGQVIGDTSYIELPEKYLELLAVVKFPFTYYTVLCSINIPKIMISEDITYFDSGSLGSECRVGITTSRIIINTMIVQDLNVTKTDELFLYYR